MTQVAIRQGIVRYQTDIVGDPVFLQEFGSYVRFNADQDPTDFVVAQYDRDYLITEGVSVNDAWGPFIPGNDYYLYWDIDFATGEVSRGYTLYDPYEYDSVDDMPPLVKNRQDQHYFDMTETVMKVRKGGWYNDVIRVFAGKYANGTSLEPYLTGSQVGINGTFFTGQILFDDDNKPLQQWQRNRKGKFATTETPLVANWNRLQNYRLDSAIAPATASEPIPIYHCVAWSQLNGNEIQLARRDDVDHPAIGVSSEDMNIGETRSYITKGWLQWAGWNWTVPPGTPLWVGDTGELTTNISQFIAVQQMGIVVDADTVFIDPQPQMIYGDGSNMLPAQFDKSTGRLFLSDAGIGGGGGLPSGCLSICGYVHDQTSASNIWTISHNRNTLYLVTQIFNNSDEQIKPGEVILEDANTVRIEFSSNITGRAHLMLFV